MRASGSTTVPANMIRRGAVDLQGNGVSVPGEMLIIDAGAFPDTPPDVLAEVDSILALSGPATGVDRHRTALDCRRAERVGRESGLSRPDARLRGSDRRSTPKGIGDPRASRLRVVTRVTTDGNRCSRLRRRQSDLVDQDVGGGRTGGCPVAAGAMVPAVRVKASVGPDAYGFQMAFHRVHRTRR